MFRDREDAGRRLADVVRRVVPPDSEAVVLGLPRGGVPVAREVADALGAPLDVLVVRKLGAPSNPEFALGALAEGDVRVVDEGSVRSVGATADELDRVAERERAELARRVAAYRGERAARELDGRTVVIVDDGIATGATALAAVRSARGRGAARVVVAVPVAPAAWRDGPLAREADLLVTVDEPADLGAVGASYRDFSPTADEEVRAALDRGRPAPGLSRTRTPRTP